MYKPAGFYKKTELDFAQTNILLELKSHFKLRLQSL